MNPELAKAQLKQARLEASARAALSSKAAETEKSERGLRHGVNLDLDPEISNLSLDTAPPRNTLGPASAMSYEGGKSGIKRGKTLELDESVPTLALDEKSQPKNGQKQPPMAA